MPGRDSMGREQRETPGLIWVLVSRNREWGLQGRDKPEQEQREDSGPVWIE